MTIWTHIHDVRGRQLPNQILRSVSPMFACVFLCLHTSIHSLFQDGAPVMEIYIGKFNSASPSAPPSDEQALMGLPTIAEEAEVGESKSKAGPRAFR